jgi:hypothetical protein
MKTTILTGALAIALAMAAPYSSQAKTREATQPLQSPSPSSSMTHPGKAGIKVERSIPFHGKVGNVDVHGKKVTLSTKQGMGRTFTITEATLITKAGNKGTLRDVIVGEEIRGVYLKRPDGSLELKSLRVGPPTVAELQIKEQRKARAKERAAEKVTPQKKSQY